MNQNFLIIFTHLGVGGVQRKIVDIVNFLAISRSDLPIYIVLRSKEKFDLGIEIKNKKVKIINYQDWIKTKIKIPYFFPFFIVWQIFRLKPKAILSFLDYTSLPAIWAKLLMPWRKIRLVLSEDHYASGVIPTFTLGRLRCFLVKIFYPFANTVFSCSQATAQDLIINFNIPKNKVRVVRNWTLFRKRKNKNKKKIYDLIYIGRFYKTKNLGFLLRVLKEMRRKKKDIKLCLLGEGEEKENLCKLVNKYHLNDNVDFVPPQYKIENFLNLAKILVYSSFPKVEGFPMIFLEAMALGTPVLSKEFVGVKEFLKDGYNGCLFKTEKEFIEKALWLLKNKKERNKLAVRAENYIKKYHLKDNINDYLKALHL